MNDINQKYGDTLQTIKDFCNFIDKCADEESYCNLFTFLDECQKYITKLYSQICSLPEFETEYLSKSRNISEDIKNQRLQRFYFVSEKIKNILGNHDLYWSVFNPHKLDNDDPSQSRLSNDIAEIYDDLMGSIDEFHYFDLSVEEKLDNLKFSLTVHWHDHAFKALTSISWLLYDKIDWDDYN